MANEAEAAPADAVEEERSKTWQPSRRPLHHASVQEAESGRIVEQLEEGGIVGAIGRYLKRPFVRLLIGLGAFVLAAILYDNYVNFGSWTERAERQKATNHRGLAPIQKTPDG